MIDDNNDNNNAAVDAETVTWAFQNKQKHMFLTNVNMDSKFKHQQVHNNTSGLF